MNLKKKEPIDNAMDESLDVCSSCNNICHREESEAVKQKLQKVTETQTVLNNFAFDGKTYLQKKGCAMSTEYPPSYANLFVGSVEEKLIYTLLKNLSSFAAFYIQYVSDLK